MTESRRRTRRGLRAVLRGFEVRTWDKSGHAVAIVGYNENGFIVQNSWGQDWGEKGFAHLPYEDWMMNATDVRTAQLGVPGTTELWESQSEADTTAGLHRAAPGYPSPTFDVCRGRRQQRRAVAIRELLDLGGRFLTAVRGDYTRADRGWIKRRVLLYLHGGLNDEEGVARRIVAFRDLLLDNEIYPLHVIWESGVMESPR